MLRITLVPLFLLQIEISGGVVAEGRKLRGGIFFEEAAAQQATVTPEEWEARKYVRYIGQVDYALSAAEPPKAAVKTQKPVPQRAKPKSPPRPARIQKK
jgi:hypothetical protein